MSLDKQKILNELGNVVNQLKSADCGCMGKLFANSNQPNPNTMSDPGSARCMRGCCHGCGHGCHGYNAPGAGEPFSGNQNCMGCCNPPKLYADTYNYLNHNLMQPIVKEVYNDLKSLTPANTVVNNPMAAQMGLSQGNNPSPTGAGMGGQMGHMTQNQMPGGATGNSNNHGPHLHFGNTNMAKQIEYPNNLQQMGQAGQPMGQSGQSVGQMGQPMGQMGQPMGQMGQPMGQMGQPMGQMSQPMGQMGQTMGKMGQPMGQMGQPMASMGGMGPNIVNMMMGDAGARMSNKPNQDGAQLGLEGNNQSPDMGTMNMRGDVGQGQYNAGMTGNNPGQYSTGNMGQGTYNMSQRNPGVPMQNPTTQYMTQSNKYGNAVNGNMSQMNPGSQPMGSMSASPGPAQMNTNNPYGQHAEGISKFNEMFPGVMTGELGFDPMAIAIQMNPANKQRAAMETMQKMMLNNREAMMQPVVNATNAAAASIAQASSPPMNQAPIQQNIPPGSISAAIPIQNNQVPQQQVYTALTGAPSVNQQQIMPQQQIPTQQQQYQQQNQGQYQQQNQGQYQQQQIIDPNTGAVVSGNLPTVYEGSGELNIRQEGSPHIQSASPTTQYAIKEPIFPADTSRNLPPAYMNAKPQKYYQYNTLGQPIEMLPADVYRTKEPNLPQTLSPQPISSRTNQAKYSNVKNTVSKTSLAGNRPVGRTPSIGQLQQIYNQYKGSQSFTQQNIKPTDNGGASYSEGRLNIPRPNMERQAPVERVGGDTLVNNAMNSPVGYKVEQMAGQVGDVPTGNKPHGDVEKVPVTPTKVRNGLQDQTYTSYATSAAWSFHGATPAPYPINYRFRTKT